MNISRQLFLSVILAAVFFELSDGGSKRRRRRRVRKRRRLGGDPRMNRKTGSSSVRKTRGYRRRHLKNPRRRLYGHKKYAVTERTTTTPNYDMIGFDDDFLLPKQFCPCAKGEPESNEEWEALHSRFLIRLKAFATFFLIKGKKEPPGDWRGERSYCRRV